MSMTADRERNRQSLQDLAKMASGLTPGPGPISTPHGVQRAAEAKKDDSGIVDLAAAAKSDPNAAMRAQSTPLASQGLFDEEPHSQRPQQYAHPVSGPMPVAGPASYVPHQPPPSIPPMPASIPPASYAHTPSAPPVGYAGASVHPLPVRAQEKKSGGGAIALVVGGLVALSAAAAGGFFYMKSHKAAEAPVAVVAPPAATPTQVAPPPSQPAATPDPTPAPEPSMDPNALPAANNGKLALAPKTASKGGAPAHAAAPPPPAPKAEGPAKMTEKDLAAAPDQKGDLGAAIKKEVGPEADKDKQPAASVAGSAGAGNVPQKPSQGAVTGALGAVLPQARACLGPDDPISRASVVFSSNGAVQSVTVSGGAAGKPAETCIKSALTKAKVQAFAESTYTANITIRHN